MSAVRTHDRPEVSLVGGQVGVEGEEGSRSCEIPAREAFDQVRGLDLREGGQFPGSTVAFEDRVIQFRQHERRHDKWATSRLCSFEKEGVVFLTVVEDEIFEEALSAYLGFDVLDRVHERLEREGLALSEEESLKLAYEELHAMRAEQRDVESRKNRTG